MAAGNDSTLEVSQQVPATYPEVIAVASTTVMAGTSACAGHPSPVIGDTASYFTTDGAFDSLTGIGVSVSAPGEDREDITKSCFLKSVGILSTRLGGGTVRTSGTSMAAPHVAGVVALMTQQSPALTPEDARRRLRLGADALDIAPLDSPAAGYSVDGKREGIVSAPGALSAPEHSLRRRKVGCLGRRHRIERRLIYDGGASLVALGESQASRNWPEPTLLPLTSP